MFLIALFGALLMVLSIIMIIRPSAFAAGIVRFSQMRYFHLFEIISRLLAGVAFICFADDTAYPGLTGVMGWVLLGVGIGLILTPSTLHRRFAVWSAMSFRNLFRPAGVASLAFGAYIVYTAVMGPA